jgi:DNA-binding CsgD family transcriptional regulator
MNDVAVTQLPENEARRPRLGRPRGSTGHQAERFRCQLASLVVSGKRNIEIARALGVSAKTVRLWL